MTARENPRAYKFVKMVNANPRGKAVKMHGDRYTGAGNPDVIGSLHGVSFVVEFKKDAVTEPDPIQLHELSLWSHAGAIALIEYDPTLAFAHLQELVQKKLAR